MTTNVPPLVLDVRPIFERGETPCKAIDDAIASLRAGQDLHLIAPFKPAPLFDKLARLGFGHVDQPLENGAWQIEFRRDGATDSPAAATAESVSCGCSCGH